MSEFEVVELHDVTQDLCTQLRDHARTALVKGLIPIAYFYWNGCEPCRVIEALLQSDPRFRSAFQGVYLIKLEHERWEAKLLSTPFAYEGVPVFFRLDGEGNHAGMIDGSAWDDDTADKMADALSPFFAGSHAGSAPLSASQKDQLFIDALRQAGLPTAPGEVTPVPGDLSKTRRESD